ncbi:MAG: long-chain fatty acid--CoA ligase [Actinobacteria bacterium]|nr:long-chain fatty acid--CoA ligase [Actinomycetota bacterium]MCG2818428.1 long-chain fatty acid--CoA ligase [Actinomycetes bacterium]MBU4219946.1 long-chain fatty acid--CoA ligase [Actinomycetota bacterium]MBU4358292.1 long-chain fatty acid--CoA ligase [Actinomycetota bacterium]MBU4392827.1 long-chain fatty acid--CoA ligase [Actinomycetota bacterium]
MNFVEYLERSAERFPDKVVLIRDEQEVTYSELLRDVNRFGNALASVGIGPGDKVALMMNNRPEFVVVYYGTAKIGATVVLVNTLLKKDEIKYILEDSGCRILVANETGAREFADAAGEIPAIERVICTDLVDGTTLFSDFISGQPEELETYDADPDDVPEIKYTSGTTGTPKGVMHTHRNITIFAETVTGMNDLSEADRAMLFLPLYHGFGDMCCLHPTLRNGASMVLQDPLDLQRIFEDIDRYKCTSLPGVPAFFFMMCQFPDADKYDMSSLRFCAGGGQSMPREVTDEFEEKFGCVILEGYGLTESTAGTASNALDKPRKVGSVGLPLPCIEVKIFDDDNNEVAQGERGEIVIKGDLNMKGYLNKPEETEEVMKGGWLHTGDIGMFDEDGYLYIVDRKKEMIITSGENVYPSEIEGTLYGHPAIGQVAVVAAPDPRRGEVPKAVVALKPGATLTEEELIDWCKERMAMFKVPRVVEFREGLPVGPTGKVAKKEL